MCGGQNNRQEGEGIEPINIYAKANPRILPGNWRTWPRLMCSLLCQEVDVVQLNYHDALRRSGSAWVDWMDESNLKSSAKELILSKHPRCSAKVKDNLEFFSFITICIFNCGRHALFIAGDIGRAEEEEQDQERDEASLDKRNGIVRVLWLWFELEGGDFEFFLFFIYVFSAAWMVVSVVIRISKSTTWGKVTMVTGR